MMIRQISLKKCGRVYFFCYLYMMALQLVYENFIIPLYSYAGFTNNFYIMRMLVSYILLLPIPIFLQNAIQRKELSWKITAFLLLCSYIPSLVLHIYMESSFLNLIVVYFYLLMICVAKFRGIHIKVKQNVGLFWFHFIGVVLCFSIIYIWGKYSRFHLQVDFIEVYEQRQVFTDYNMNIFLKYIFGSASSIIPFFVIFYIYKKKKLLSLLYIIMQYIVFCIGAHKSALFLLVVSIFLYFLLQKNINLIMWYLLIFAFCSVPIVLMRDKLLYIGSYLYRRSLFIPASIHYAYYDYFTNHQLDYFRSSILKFFYKSPYSELGIPKTIGLSYYGGSNANNGLFSDAYGNLGLWGCIIMPLILAVFLKILDDATRGIDSRITVFLVVLVTIALLSSSFFTNMLSHGLLPMILIFYFMPRERKHSVS